LNINVTALVQDMIIQPLSSFGFRISLVDEQVTRGLVFYSSEAPTPDLWPALTVVYGNCDLTTAMEEHDATNLALRPSLVPRNGEIILDGKEERTSLIFIFDMAGSIVRSLEAKQWPSRIGVEGLASGTYILTAQDAQHHVIFRDKFVIE